MTEKTPELAATKRPPAPRPLMKGPNGKWTVRDITAERRQFYQFCLDAYEARKGKHT